MISLSVKNYFLYKVGKWGFGVLGFWGFGVRRCGLCRVVELGHRGTGPYHRKVTNRLHHTICRLPPHMAIKAPDNHCPVDGRSRASRPILCTARRDPDHGACERNRQVWDRHEPGSPQGPLQGVRRQQWGPRDCERVQDTASNQTHQYPVSPLQGTRRPRRNQYPRNIDTGSNCGHIHQATGSGPV